MLDDLKQIHYRDKNDALGRAAKKWQQSASWRPEIATKNNLAKQLALELMGRSVVIYAGEKLLPAARQWKLAINQNAKQAAWCGELTDSEFAGWSQQPVQKPYAIIELRSSFETEREKKFFEQSEKLLSGRRPVPNVVEAQGKTITEQLHYSEALADFVSIYLAILANIDPSDLTIVDKLKQRMEK